MAGFNQCNFIGNLGRDIEIRYTQSGMAVGNGSLGVTEKIKGQDRTEWVRLVFWDKAAEIVSKYAGKGSSMFVSGKMQTRTWEKDGQTQYITEVHVRDFQFLGGGSQAKDTGGQGYQQKPASNPGPARNPQNDRYPAQQSYQQSQAMQDDDISF